MTEKPKKFPTEDITSANGDLNPALPLRDRLSREGYVSETLAGQRLDQIAAALFPEFSRGKLQKWIANGSLTVDGASFKSKQKIAEGCHIRLEADFEPEVSWQPEPIELDIVFEDDDFLVINKPKGLVVHPADTVPTGTLANAVLAHVPLNSELPRCGIVHRLDKDTTGLMVVAKSLQAHASLVHQLQERTVSRHYRAVICGEIIAGGTIDKAIGRHPTHRTKMAVLDPSKTQARHAITHYRIRARFRHFTEIDVYLETGRTHQIRVHMAHIKHPLVGDATYNARHKRPRDISDQQDLALKQFDRQALHAFKLSFVHPRSQESCEFHVDPPSDYLDLIEVLAGF